MIVKVLSNDQEYRPILSTFHKYICNIHVYTKVAMIDQFSMVAELDHLMACHHLCILTDLPSLPTTLYPSCYKSRSLSLHVQLLTSWPTTPEFSPPHLSLSRPSLLLVSWYRWQFSAPCPFGVYISPISIYFVVFEVVWVRGKSLKLSGWEFEGNGVSIWKWEGECF